MGGVLVRVCTFAAVGLLAGPAMADSPHRAIAQSQSASSGNDGVPADATPGPGDDGSVIDPDGDDGDATAPGDDGDDGDDPGDDGGDDGGLPPTDPV
jgi:hypothetical protein